MNRAVVARWIETFSTALEEDDGDDDDDDDDDDDGGNDVVAMFWCQGVGEEADVHGLCVDYLAKPWSRLRQRRHCAGAEFSEEEAEDELPGGISWLPPLNVSAPAETAEGRVLPLFPLGGAYFPFAQPELSIFEPRQLRLDYANASCAQEGGLWTLADVFAEYYEYLLSEKEQTLDFEMEQVYERYSLEEGEDRQTYSLASEDDDDDDDFEYEDVQFAFRGCLSAMQEIDIMELPGPARLEIARLQNQYEEEA
eukprot:s2300_g5.t1